MVDVIRKIEELRLNKNWTKYELAEEAGMPYSSLASIYSRKTPPKLEILSLICSALGVTLAQFFTENEQSETVTEEERNLLIKFRLLSGEKKKAIVAFLNN